MSKFGDRLAGSFGLLARRPAFRWLMGAELASLLGNNLGAVAIPFAVHDRFESPSALGVVLAARTIPQVALMLVGGVVADRFRRDVIMVTTNVIGALCQVSLGLVLLHGVALWVPVTIAALSGAASAFTYPAVQGLVPQLVEREELVSANAIGGLVRNGSLIVGGAMAGLVVGVFGPPVALYLDGVTYAIAALALLRMGKRLLRLGPGPDAGDWWRSLVNGWQEFVARRWVWGTVAAYGLFGAVSSGVMGILGPLLADRTIGRIAWGTLGSLTGIGMLLGTMWMLRRPPPRPLVFGTVLMIVSASAQLVSFASGAPLVVMGIFWLLAGIGGEIFTIAWMTALQREIPQDRLSRVSSWDALFSFAGGPVGQILAGPLALGIGIGGAMYLGAGLLLAILCALLLVRGIWTVSLVSG